VLVLGSIVVKRFSLKLSRLGSLGISTHFFLTALVIPIIAFVIGTAVGSCLKVFC